jgi:hypothetical protein
VHALLSLQSRGVPATHAPEPLQTSAPSQGSAFAQLTPATTLVCIQPPLGSHASALHGLLSSQSSVVPGRHVPTASHVSRPLHTVASSHAVPISTGVWVQPTVASHTSVVHALVSLQSSAVPDTHVPDALHVSRPLQTVASSHAEPVAARPHTPLVHTEHVPQSTPVPQTRPALEKSAELSSVSVALALRERIMRVAGAGAAVMPG